MKNKKLLILIISLVATITLFFVEIFLGEHALGPGNVNLFIILPISLSLFLLNSFDLFRKTIKSFRNKDFFDEIVLTLIATIAAFAIQQFVEGLAIIVFYKLGEYFEDYAVNKSRESIKSTINLRTENVTLENGQIVEPFDVEIGSICLAKPGERIMIDGILESDNASIDVSSITGESTPIYLTEGEIILSGSLVLDSAVKYKTTKEYANSTLFKIIDIVENASSVKSKPVKFITKFAKIYTPIVIALAFLVATVLPMILGINNPDIWTRYIKIGASFLVISCPCALVLSVPMAYFVSLGEASKNKVLIKGSTFLDLIPKAKTIYLDKTGTLTKGNFAISKIEVTQMHTESEVLNYLKLGEFYSNHPIANAIKNYSKNENSLDINTVKNWKEIKGKGISYEYENDTIIIGNFEFLTEFCGVFDKNDSIFTTIYVAKNNQLIGYIEIRDEIKDTTKLAIQNLYYHDIKSIIMLSGDNENICKEIAESCSITDYKANLLPFDKEEIIKNSSERPVMYVGDGINDSPSLIAADIGVSMGNIGSDVAIEASDIVLMNDDLNSINKIIKISKRNKRIVIFNIAFALLMKIGIMVLDLIPGLPIEPYIMYLAIFADVGVTVICVLNVLILLTREVKIRNRINKRK